MLVFGNVKAKRTSIHFLNYKKYYLLFRRADITSKVTASTTTRSTTRRSGDLMGDQMAPGDQMGDQIFDMTKM